MKSMKTITTIIVLILGTWHLSGQILPPKHAYPLEVRQIHSGHSLTDPLFGQPWPGQYVNLLTHLRGTWAGDDIAKATIPGSPMFWRWNNENSLSPSARHDISDWELLVITEGIPIPQHWQTGLITDANEYFSLYVNNALEHGNNGNGAATLLWTTWTNIDDSDGPWRATLDEYELFWEEMMDYANTNRPNNATPVYIIPGHRMMAQLYDDIQLNLVPGITDISDFFSDNIHTNTLGDYAIALIHYACIFNQSPEGLPNDLMPNPPQGFMIPSLELAAYLQNMIWEVVTTYPRTGITNPTTSNDHYETISKTIDVFPNPVTDFLYIKNKNTTISAEKYIYNSMGRTVYHGTENEISLSHLPAGIYFLKVGDFFGKIIKH